MHNAAVACLASLFATFAGLAEAQILAQSTFDAGDDGWRSVELNGPFVHPPSVEGPLVAPDHFASGGNPGGYVCEEDLGTRWTYAVAPAAFLGDKSAAIGGTLQFDVAVAVGNPHALGYRSVILVGGGRTLYHDHGGVADATFQTFTVTFAPSPAWKVNGIDGVHASPTDAEMLDVLGNLTAIYISQEWVDAFYETVYIDNVVMSAPGVVSTEAVSWGSVKSEFR